MDERLSGEAAMLDLLERLLRAARRAGAQEAEAALAESAALQVTCRMGQCEALERAETHDLGLRVFVGRKQAGVSLSGAAPKDLDAFAARAVAMARAAPDDPYCGLADAPPPAGFAELDICSGQTAGAEALEAQARAAEEAALAVPGIENSEGARASAVFSRRARADTKGFAAVYAATRRGLSCTALAVRNGQMERDYDYTLARHAGDLDPPEQIGRAAAARALARLDPRKPASRILPVLYEARAARRLLAAFAAAVSGAAVARGASFLRSRLGKPVFAPGIQITDDPCRRRGLRARPFDSEGVSARPLRLVADGVLASFLLDSASARQLGLAATGHAAAAPGAVPAPAPSNLALAPGPRTPGQLIAELKAGFCVTELIGQGVNLVTGDYSQGAAGFWIENGQRSHAVSEVTLAGNLAGMFRTLEPADDLEHRTGLDCPSLLIPAMTLAGA